MAGLRSWLAVVTLTTLGADSPTTTGAGKLFAIAYLLCGLGVASYSLFALGQTVVSAEFRQHVGAKRRMERRGSPRWTTIMWSAGSAGWAAACASTLSERD